MKLVRSFLVFLIVGMLFVPTVQAYTFTPTDLYMGNLPHQYYYTWGIDTSIIPADAIIVDAYITFSNVQNSSQLPQNRGQYPNGEPNELFVNLFDSAPVGLVQNWDLPPGTSEIRNEFEGPGGVFLQGQQGVYLGSYTDTAEGPENVRFYINPANYSWILDGNVGFGIDPDCSYYNSGISFTVNAVPEPATMLLLGTGLVGIATFARRRFRRGVKQGS